jgi:hypothetical protein
MWLRIRSAARWVSPAPIASAKAVWAWRSHIVKLAESLYALGLKTSKIGAWAAPRTKARGATEKFLATENRS